MPENTPEERILTRWVPSPLLDLPPLEPVFAVRTPHRVCFQAIPSSRDVMRQLLLGTDFDVTLELDSEQAPLQHVPIHDVHEARLTPERPLDWAHYYWIVDGLQDDVREARNATVGLARGRERLAVVARTFREVGAGRNCQVWHLEQAWANYLEEPVPLSNNVKSEPMQTLQQYVRGLTGHLVSHASVRPFADWAADLLQEAERQPMRQTLPQLGEAENKVLQNYLQHRLFGSAWLTAPSGMIAGWHLLLSVYVLAVWYSGLLVSAGYEHELEEALFGSVWMLDHGFWSDEALVHDVLQNLNASEYTTVELAVAITTAMRGESIPR